MAEAQLFAGGSGGAVVDLDRMLVVRPLVVLVALIGRGHKVVVLSGRREVAAVGHCGADEGDLVLKVVLFEGLLVVLEVVVVVVVVMVVVAQVVGAGWVHHVRGDLLLAQGEKLCVDVAPSRARL